ncbi:MAG: Rieske 2Fe-2S domain-containing protein [Dehalococcoidia bacterium]|nr:Rieske 2Fe-2S domain-containing protein [Dehalococcoidia bacterium]
MLTHEQNELLTRVGPGTPMGDLLRRYWIPALLSWELAEPDCPPITIKLVGEELVAFRQTDGKVGVVGARCAHRRAHLFWGRNEENGIRCVYHGWKFDCEGACVDMPSEPEESNFKDKVRIPAYPTYEVGGVVWCYMGPPDKKPAPPLFEWTQVPATHRGMTKVWQQCNWLQALEGGIDSVHTSFLHTAVNPARGVQRARSAVVEVVPAVHGSTYTVMRDLPDDLRSVNGYHWVMPWHQIRNGGDVGSHGHMWVPIDDENTMVFNFHWTWGDEPLVRRLHDGEAPPKWGSLYVSEDRRGPGRGGILVAEEGAEQPIWMSDALEPIGMGNEFGLDVDIDDNFRSRRNMANQYLIDRDIQKRVTFTGIEGVNTQDRAVQESMGAIADRTLERLGTTDRMVIYARRSLLRAINTVRDGGEPPGVAPTYYKLRAASKVLPKQVNWFEALKVELYQLEEGEAARSS